MSDTQIQTMDVLATGTVSVTVERRQGGKWVAYWMTHCTEELGTREEAIEKLRKQIVGACFANNVIAVETVELRLGRSNE